MTFRYIVGLGSNHQMEEKFPAMVSALLESFGEIWLSPVYKTVSTTGCGSEYLNAVVSLISHLQPHDFKKECKRIEFELGRVRPSSYCVADIDILACWDQPEPTCAQLFIEESYYWPQTDSVLDRLGLCDRPISGVAGGVQLNLPDGRAIGQATVLLQMS